MLRCTEVSQQTVAPGHQLPRPLHLAMSALRPIVLQNSFLACVQNFPGALMRSVENYVGGQMFDPISNREPS
jgi:hypothetical protein